jgi:cyclopropane fatty-acyl-phospholipid synthase-like methyltransferase
MIRYGAAAVALKAFSLNGTTQRAYRRIGNHFGPMLRRNESIDIYRERGELLVETYRKHDRLRPGDHLLEIGTGWIHWYAVYLRLFNPIRLTTLDIVDNRQFESFHTAFARLQHEWEAEDRPREATQLLDRLVAADGFDEVYRILDLDHVIVPDGSIQRFETGSLASVFSMHVLEHVHRALVPALVQNMFRIIEPGRITVHQIGIDDHLAHYDRRASAKQYIKYSDRTWSWFFDNEVQYHNRMQMSEWIQTFEDAGFVLLDKLVESTSVDDIDVSRRFRDYSRDDLACTILTLVFRRP